MKQVLIPTLAIITGITSTFAVVQAETTLHASATSLEDRVEARRSARLNEDTSKSITELRELRQDRSRSRTPVTTRQFSSRRTYTTRSRASSSSSVRSVAPTRAQTMNLQSRMEQRRAMRLEALPSPLKFQVIEAVNMERAKMGLAPLSAQIDLETSAQKHAEDMKARDFFSHENPDGIRSQGRIKATGYGVINAQECRCSYKVFLGENLAKGQTSVSQVIEEWMNSPSHREAMLSRDYDEIGVGLIDDIWVLNFGKVEITIGG
jgi:uncharacterized protein YkwD